MAQRNNSYHGDEHASPGDVLFENLVEPAIMNQIDVWDPVDVDRLISRLVKFRNRFSAERELQAARSAKEKREQTELEQQTKAAGQDLIGAGLVTGFLRENPLLNQHKKAAQPAPESGPEDLRKYRKDLITSAMGSYCGGHTRRRRSGMATKYVKDSVSGESQRRETIPDPIATCDEDALYKHRAQMIQSMLDSTGSDVEIATQLTSGSREGPGGKNAYSALPDGVRATFMRNHTQIRSPITGDLVSFY